MPSKNRPAATRLAEPSALPPGSALRFNVTDGSRRSADWRAWTVKNADDVYAAARLVAGEIKISLHQSGSWQHGFTSDDKAKGFRLPEQRRHFTIWQRPEEVMPGWTRAVRILIPDAALQERTSLATAKKPVADLLTTPDGDTTIAEIWLESAANTTPPPLEGTQIAGRLSQPGGGTVWIVGQRVGLPWDPYQRFGQMVAAARSEAMRLNPGWTGDPPLSICLHDPVSLSRELILCEVAVTWLAERKRGTSRRSLPLTLFQIGYMVPPLSGNRRYVNAQKRTSAFPAIYINTFSASALCLGIYNRKGGIQKEEYCTALK